MNGPYSLSALSSILGMMLAIAPATSYPVKMAGYDVAGNDLTIHRSEDDRELPANSQSTIHPQTINSPALVTLEVIDLGSIDLEWPQSSQPSSPTVSTPLNEPSSPSELTRLPELFEPLIEPIQSSLPNNMVMRLPTEIQLLSVSSNESFSYSVELTQPIEFTGLVIELSVCPSNESCTEGHFSVEEAIGTNRAELIQTYQERGHPITLAPGIQGYLMTKQPDGTPSPTMSVMWEQDELVHTVSFPSQERQNILYMARSMALSSPITGDTNAVNGRQPESLSSNNLASDISGSDVSDSNRLTSNTPLEDSPERVVDGRIADGRMTGEHIANDIDDVADPTIIQRSNPNQERLIQPNPDEPSPLDHEELILPTEDLSPSEGNLSPSEDEQTIEGLQNVDAVVVQAVRVRNGQTLSQTDLAFSQETFNETLEEELESRSLQDNGSEAGIRLTSEDLIALADAVTALYLDDGYLTSRARGGNIKEGIAWIDVIEGRLSSIVIHRLDDDENRSTSSSDSDAPGSGEEESNSTTLEDEESDSAMSTDAEISNSQGNTNEEISDEESEEQSHVTSTSGLRIRESYIRSRVELAAGPPLRLTDLEEQLRLLRQDPIFDNIEASLRPTNEPGQSELVLWVKEANPFAVGLSVDNYSPPSVGSERLGIDFSYLNLTGRGDELAGSYFRTTTGGLNTFDVTYRIPVNPMNGRVQLRASADRTEVTLPPFDRLDIEGETERYEISFRQPFIRRLTEEFALSWGFRYQDGQTFVFDDVPTPFRLGPDEDGVSRTSIFTFGQDYVRRESKGAWAATSQFNFGTGLFDATTNDEPIPDGHFFSWQGQLQRVQRIGQNHLLLARADVQLSPDSLLASDQFVIGGGQLLRGYRQNVRTGDNGFRFSIEDRFTLRRTPAGLPDIQLVPFFDTGAVWNSGQNPNDIQAPNFLAAVGLGLLWDWFFGVEDLSIRFDFAVPIVDIDDQGNNAQDEGVFFQILYNPD